MNSSNQSQAGAVRTLGCLSVLLLVSLLTRGPFFVEPPGRDQGTFVTQAALILDGANLYSEIWENKPPGVIALYVLAMLVFGRDYLAIHLLNWLAGSLTAVLIFQIGRRSGLSLLSSVAGGCLYLAFFAGPIFGGFWVTAQTEIFLDPLVCFALLGLLVPSSERARVGVCLGAGIATGTAIFVLKYSALPLVLLVTLLLSRGRKSRWIAEEAGAFLAGVTIPAVLLVFYFAGTGRFESWTTATIEFNLKYRGVASVPWWNYLLPLTFPFPHLFLPLYAFSTLGVIDRLRRWRAREQRPGDRLLFAGTVLYGIALAQVFFQGKFWVYHYHVILLPLCLLAGIGIDAIVRILDSWVGRRVGWVAIAVALVLMLLPATLDTIEYASKHGIRRAWQDEDSIATFYHGYRWGVNDYNYGNDRTVAKRLAETTSENDRVLIWGFEPVVYFLSNRRPATRFLYDYPLMTKFESVHERHVAWLMEDLQAHTPKMILVLKGDLNDVERVDSLTQLGTIPPLRCFLEKNYTPAWQMGNFLAFAVKPEAIPSN